jgi:hypothetical protein
MKFNVNKKGTNSFKMPFTSQSIPKSQLGNEAIDHKLGKEAIITEMQIHIQN